MSVESLVVAALVEEGSPRKAFQAGIGSDDFTLYQDEFQWICERAQKRQPINARIFRQAFDDFEWAVSSERISDLLEELKQESAYVDLSAGIDEVLNGLTSDNAIEKAEMLKEISGTILRNHAPQSDVLLNHDFKHHLEEQKHLRILQEQGETIGIPTGFKNLDHHWGGLMPGRMVLVLGRPGDAKSLTLAKFFISSFLDGRNVAMFSPEMNEREHRCRVATLLSADPEIQKEVGIKNAFRNRALMEGRGYPEKKYKRFWEFIATLPGNMHLLTRTHKRTKMTPAYIESKIDDLGLEVVLVDPIYKLKSPHKRTDKRFELEDLTDAVQDLAEGFNIPMVISNQAHRQMGNRGDAPHKDNSFGSDAPVQEADHVIGVKYFEEERKLVLRCSKSRFGFGNFRVEIAFWPNIGKMDEITKPRGEYFNGSDDDADSDMLRQIKEEMDDAE